MADDAVNTLRKHVYHLSEKIGERNLAHYKALSATAEYIRQSWQGQGYDVISQEANVRKLHCENLEVTRTGISLPGEIILVGAHYDTVVGAPGANDNASGVAALLLLSEMFAKIEPRRTVRFVSFVNEEPPFFFTGQQGSHYYAKDAKRRGDDIRLMISLETIGYYRDEPGSQKYPPFFRYFYPDRGNFIAFVSNLRSRPVLRRFASAFRNVSSFPFESAATYGWIPGVSWSDHRSFWRQGFQALMITDTAFYRYPYYHKAGDTAEKLDYHRMAMLTEGLFQAIFKLAEEGI